MCSAGRVGTIGSPLGVRGWTEQHVVHGEKGGDGVVVLDDVVRDAGGVAVEATAVADPEDVPAVAVGGRRGGVEVGGLFAGSEERAGGGGKLVHLLYDAKIPVGVVFEDEGGGDAVLNDLADDVHVRTPAADYAGEDFGDLEGGWDGFVIDLGGGYAVDPFELDVGDIGGERKTVASIRAIGEADGVDFLETEGSIRDGFIAQRRFHVGDQGTGVFDYGISGMWNDDEDQEGEEDGGGDSGDSGSWLLKLIIRNPFALFKTGFKQSQSWFSIS